MHLLGPPDACSMSSAASMGHLTMPYFNPTWWDPLSPTLSPLDGDFAAVAALNASGGAYYETYPDKPVAKTWVQWRRGDGTVCAQ